MNRLGLSLDETAAVAARMQSENHGLTLLMSHFACADLPQHPLNDQQIRQFREIRTLFRGIPGSLANSSGIFLDQSAYCDMVRPGAALYGINPTPGRPNPMKPAIELQSRVLQVRNVPRNAVVGYGATWTAKRASRIAVVAAGYADGVLRAAAVTGREVIVAGKRCPVVGRISMDLLTVDVTDLPDGAVRRGHLVTLIGRDLDADTVGSQAGTIGYEVLTSLGARYSRTWKT
jgi:alanine racemase